MNYDAFKTAFLDSLHESGLPISGEPIETLDLGSMARTFLVYVEPIGNLRTEPFHVSATLKWTWDALQTARTDTREEDVVTEFLGDRTRPVKTARPWLRVDVELDASLEWGKGKPLPPRRVMANWAREVFGRLETIERVIPENQVEERRNGMPTILAWQGEPEIKTKCSPDGDLVFESISLPAWQGIDLPRVFDNPDRRDPGPEKRLKQMFERLRAALHAWAEVMDHLA